MKCNICAQSISTFHTFPKKALFNKPLRVPVPEATVAMELGYCSSCRHITSTHRSSANAKDLEKKIYEELYESFTPTGFSPSQKKYSDFVTEFISSWLGKRQRVLEIGCHDGYMLDIFHKKGHDVVGIEPSPFADLCAEKYPFKVIKAFFDPQAFEKKSFDFIIARHVLEHVPDPFNFMNGIASLLKEGGTAYIEVPNSLLSLEQTFFPEFHIDHISYFTIPSLVQLLESVGLSNFQHVESISAYMKFPFIGVIARKGPKSSTQKNQSWFMDHSIKPAIDNFVKCYDRYLLNIKKMAKGRKLAVWGTGSVGTQLAIDAGWNKNTAYYVDPNKLNQNKFLSVTGHPTWAPERLNKNKVDAVVIASGWEHDVRNQIQSVLKYKADTIGFSDLLR
jgi:2-polyprenyl-3-methyl-5-hydroxy-6-metoxy-1,4-benzoquinol methylase